MSVFAAPTPLNPSVRRDVPAVEVSHLTKEFRRRDRRAGRFARRRMPALKDVSFTMARGECVAILGQNGSGKSTLVRLLSTLLINDGGEAHIFGHDAFDDTRWGDPHHSQPSVLSLTVPTEFGTLYTIEQIGELAVLAREDTEFGGPGPRVVTQHNPDWP